MVTAGALPSVRLARGCWIAEVDRDDLAARCAAVLAGSSPHAVISSVTAARLHKLWLPTLPELIHVATADPVHRGRQMTRSKRPQFVAHRITFHADDLQVLDGLPVTTAARTWRDLAALLPLPDLVAAGDSVLRSGVTLDELSVTVARAAKGRGVVRLRQAFDLLDARSRSRPESHLRVAVRLTGLPPFAVNEPIVRPEGGWLAEPDLALAGARLALEYQGADHADPARMRKDITRERDLRLAGWRCLYFGPAEVFGRPWSVGAEVLAAVRWRAPQLVPPDAKPYAITHKRPSRRRRVAS